MSTDSGRQAGAHQLGEIGITDETLKRIADALNERMADKRCQSTISEADVAFALREMRQGR
jgi:hypothetical protein